jgi:acid phosphatase family membrane protein YuiD
MTFFRTYLFLVPLIAMVLCECAKICVEYARTGHWTSGMFTPGGMPSSHSAFVTSLLIVLARRAGVDSTQFAIAFVFACVVWYDAISLRRSVGEQAEVLNHLQHKLHLRERVGHSAREVAAGIAFGAAVTAAGIWLDGLFGGFIPL